MLPGRLSSHHIHKRNPHHPIHSPAPDPPNHKKRRLPSNPCPAPHLYRNPGIFPIPPGTIPSGRPHNPKNKKGAINKKPHPPVPLVSNPSTSPAIPKPPSLQRLQKPDPLRAAHPRNLQLHPTNHYPADNNKAPIPAPPKRKPITANRLPTPKRKSNNSVFQAVQTQVPPPTNSKISRQTFPVSQCPAVRARLSDIGGQTFQVSRGEAHKDIKPFVRQEQTGVCESSEHGIWKSLPAYFASLFRRYKT